MHVSRWKLSAGGTLACDATMSSTDESFLCTGKKIKTKRFNIKFIKSHIQAFHEPHDKSKQITELRLYMSRMIRASTSLGKPCKCESLPALVCESPMVSRRSLRSPNAKSLSKFHLRYSFKNMRDTSRRLNSGHSKTSSSS